MIYYCLNTLLLIATALPLASGFSSPVFAFPAVLPTLPTKDAVGVNNNNDDISNSNAMSFPFASLRTQFQRNDLKKKLVAAAKEKDEDLVLSLIDDLSILNPTDCPTLGLAGYGGNADGSISAVRAPLGGSWRLLYTNAKDAEEPARTEKDADGQFGKSAATGVQVATGQSIDAAKGECVNFISLTSDENTSRPFDRLEITIRMTPLNEKRVRLDFLRGQVSNANAPLAFLREFGFSFPPAVVGDVLARIRGKDPSVEPQAYFDVLYIDDSLRVHRTGLGKVFVQERA
uniref:Plastid lipid-associated protein/fibrillin conserved domain-containing protein n=1 Tax=Pseudo-nitzschia australis TaxID=44445 RepID=A0A7S4AIA9_9STRA|mmetsp:Transcript_2335/g.5014  ORF Transcript_2335/g.5014 Transcript_2335/m.5014 type:complete len:288 (+) Transcript_2335:218-1081(+)|eukprot:CAMPEP_0168172130 /NCGR_PEP_ID=MMETSP0139_2-20121125/5074_1 /TAXON_ID=44445 /ORGANISM="Pseudo-nitzschia australis, Strain 10249 10 AB" /LENGTH=287 /DNA_ID=CAMNT_0008089729 /DNA_START=208 /DNA_END=1071 /DNA_ORIENTATION=+